MLDLRWGSGSCLNVAHHVTQFAAAMVNQIVAQGRAISLFVVIGQFVQTAFHVYLQQGAFHWANALTLLLLLWFGIYLVQSRHVRDSLKAPRWIRHDHHQRDDFSFYYTEQNRKVRIRYV